MVGFLFYWEWMDKSMYKRSLIIVISFFLFLLLPLNVYSSSIREDYDLSDKCGKRCEEIYHKTYNNGVIETGKNTLFYDYENHYNKKLNKCFMLIREEGTITGTKKALTDIQENKTYGHVRKNKDYKIILCWVLDKKCQSVEEWDLLVKPYMED